MTMGNVTPAHVAYRTHRFKEMLAWYTRVFGASVQYQDPALAFLTYDDEHHRFALVDLDVIRPETAGKDDRGLVGVDHVAYSVNSLADLLESYAELKDAGILPYWCVNHGMSASLYYADPDGNQMEFTVDVFPTKAEGSAYFRGETIKGNPVGVEFDPEDWLARFRNGDRESDLLKFDAKGAVSPIRGELLTLRN
jgi:catechol-2,3-dioxygenase